VEADTTKPNQSLFPDLQGESHDIGQSGVAILAVIQ